MGGLAPYREALAARLARDGWETVDGSDRDALVICCTTEEHWSEAADNALWVPTVVVITELDVALYRRALALGAGAVHVDNPTDIIFDVIRAAVSGESLLPMSISQQLALETEADAERANRLDGIEAEIVDGLLADRSILQIADDLHFSDRTIRRKLQGIYIKLGVHDRRGAIEALRLRDVHDSAL